MATEYETLPSFVTHLISVVETCIERGMQPPFIVCLVSANGSILAVRFNVPDEPDILAEHPQDGMFRLPINGMVVDQTGEAVRVVIDKEGTTFH